MRSGGERLVEAAQGAQRLGAPGPRDSIVREILDGAVIGGERLVEAAQGAQRLGAPFRATASCGKSSTVRS